MMNDLRDSVRWAYIYDLIRLDMGFNYLDDYYASQVLNTLIKEFVDTYVTEMRVRKLIEGSDAYVVGAGPKCFEELKSLERPPEVLIAADGAMRCCLDAGYKPDIVVSDLDGLAVDDLRYEDIIYVVHAHGNNVDKLLRYVGLIRGDLLGTNQCIQYGKLRVYGGFTDGDRAVFLANYFKARTIRLVGFDLRSGVVGKYSKPWMGMESYATPLKMRKFRWAERLLKMLGLNVS